MLPPGPWTPSVWQTVRFLTDPYGYSERVLARYGKTVRVRPLNGKGVATSEPEHVKQVFAADPDTFATVPVVGDLLGKSAVIATFGATHRRQRKLLNPHFHGTRMRALFGTMQEVTRATFDRFEQAAARGEEVVLADVTQALMLDVILEATFGADRALDRTPVRAVLEELVEALVPSLFGAPVLRASWNPAWRRLQAARAEFDALVDAQVATRRALASPGEDLLGTFVAARFEDGAPMAADEIRDQLFTVLMAGHETTAMTLAWAIHHLLRNRETLETLRGALAEVDPEDLRGTLAVPYLEAVCSETLRLEPPVTDVARLCTKPLALGSWTVPAGQLVIVNVAALHRDPALYPEPERFRPERFLERKFTPWEHVPFGGGQRRCLGAAFAEAELGIAVATFAREWNAALASDAPERRVRRGITMGPKDGVRLRIVGRRTAPSVAADARTAV